MKQPRQAEEISSEQKAQILREFKQDHEQVELAKKRMGSNSADLLRWVADFAQTNLSLLRPEERQAKGYDLRALPDLVKERRGRSPKSLAAVSKSGSHAVGPMDAAVFEAIHSSIGLCIRKLFGDELPSDPGLPSLWEMPAWRSFVYRSSPEGSARTRFGIMRQTATEAERVLAAVVDLIFESGGKLRACPQCGRVFMSERRQKFCSTRHGQEARNQEKHAEGLRGKLGERAADRYLKARRAKGRRAEQLRIGVVA